MLANCTPDEYAAAIDAARRNAIPGDVPAWLDELKSCPVCHNAGWACWYCEATRKPEPPPTDSRCTCDMSDTPNAPRSWCWTGCPNYEAEAEPLPTIASTEAAQ